MMETVNQLGRTGASILPARWPANDVAGTPLAMTCSTFTRDAVAHIAKPSRSAMTSGKARTKKWRLWFERRSAPLIEPLMGWTGSDDMMSAVELEFPTREAAIRYAEREGLTYTIDA